MSVEFSFLAVYKTETVCGKMEKRLKFGAAFLVFVPIIIWAGFRGNIADTPAYVSAFEKMPTTFGEIPTLLKSVSKDKGFSFLSTIIKIIFGNNSTTYLLVLALIQGIILVEIYRKYSSNYFMSIFLFVASTDFLSWMFNGVRQFTAVTIIFAATGLMLKKKYILLIVIILIASTIHGSALIMLPFVFIMQGKAWNKKTVLFILGSMAVLLFVNQFTSILDILLTDTQYTNVVSDWQMWGDDGTNIFRVLVYSIPALLSFIGRKYIDSANDIVINLATNASIISTGLYIISSVTSGIFLGRLPIFVSLYGYILLPWEIDNMFTKESAKLVKIVLIVCYLVFYWYQLLSWGNI